MTNPVLVEVLRGAVVESAHRGAIAVFEADGKPVWEIGDTARPVF
ncbi:MAG: asparaginase, partial [Mesorhizobium sp.]